MAHRLYQELLQWPLHSPRFWFDAAAILSLIVLANYLARYKWLFIAFVLPGTIAHELAHWSIALLCGGRPLPPSLWPRTAGPRWTLGEVTIRNPRWYNLAQIALAPLLLLPLAVLIYRHWLQFYSLVHWQHWLGLYLVAMLLHSSIPSREDFALLLRLRWPLLIIAGIAIGLLVALRR
jgi:hypothetical protein